MKQLIWVSLLLVIGIGCHKTDDENQPVDANNLLIGVWINAEFNDSLYQMTRSLAFVDTLDGMEFKADGTFIQRVNIGDCGTPPISYTNYTGQWTQMPDSMVFIETEYWGGPVSYSLKIYSVTDHKMEYLKESNLK